MHCCSGRYCFTAQNERERSRVRSSPLRDCATSNNRPFCPAPWFMRMIEIFSSSREGLWHDYAIHASSSIRLTVDGVAEDDGLVDLQLGEEGVEAVHFLALCHEGVELRDTLLRVFQRTKTPVRRAHARSSRCTSRRALRRELA